jgi:hypothetical protein
VPAGRLAEDNRSGDATNEATLDRGPKKKKPKPKKRDPDIDLDDFLGD